jgi:hypothetical protein
MTITHKINGGEEHRFISEHGDFVIEVLVSGDRFGVAVRAPNRLHMLEAEVGKPNDWNCLIGGKVVERS